MEKLVKSVKEIRQEVTGRIKGSIPVHLRGSLLRVGPGKWDLEDGFTLNHYLDGCAIVVKIKISDNDQLGDKNDGTGGALVTYSSRFVESDAYKKMMALNRPVFTEFGTRAYSDTSKSIWKRAMGKLVPSDLTDNDISNIYKVKGQVYVATESCNIWQVDTKHLGVKNKTNIDKLTGVSICCSHPHSCDNEGVTYNIGSSFLTGMKYHVMKIPNDDNKQSNLISDSEPISSGYKEAEIIATIPSAHLSSFSYTHSFFVTCNYIIFVEQPLTVNGYKLATCTPKGKPMADCLEWLGDEPTRFHVIDKKSGKVIDCKYQSAAFYYFHTINAYEDPMGDFIILDFICYQDSSVLDKYTIKNLRAGIWDDSCPPVPKRFILPIGNKIINDNSNSNFGANLNYLTGSEAITTRLPNGTFWMQPEQLGPAGFELPRINYQQCNGKPYQYIYGSGVFEKGFYANSVCKLDTKTKEAKIWRESETAFPGEGVFIPRPGGTDEDDGHVLSLVIETNVTKCHFLVILCAKSMTEVARVEFNQDEIEIPATIHGLWLNE